jgi:hypothetical protein
MQRRCSTATLAAVYLPPENCNAEIDDFKQEVGSKDRMSLWGRTRGGYLRSIARSFLDQPAERTPCSRPAVYGGVAWTSLYGSLGENDVEKRYATELCSLRSFVLRWKGFHSNYLKLASSRFQTAWNWNEMSGTLPSQWELPKATYHRGGIHFSKTVKVSRVLWFAYKLAS